MTGKLSTFFNSPMLSILIPLFINHSLSIKCQKFSTSLEPVAESQFPFSVQKISEHAQEPRDAANSSNIPPIYDGGF
jgi:hypothetical protein